MKDQRSWTRITVAILLLFFAPLLAYTLRIDASASEGTDGCNPNRQGDAGYRFTGWTYTSAYVLGGVTVRVNTYSPYVQGQQVLAWSMLSDGQATHYAQVGYMEKPGNAGGSQRYFLMYGQDLTGGQLGTFIQWAEPGLPLHPVLENPYVYNVLYGYKGVGVFSGQINNVDVLDQNAQVYHWSFQWTPLEAEILGETQTGAAQMPGDVSRPVDFQSSGWVLNGQQNWHLFNEDGRAQVINSGYLPPNYTPTPNPSGWFATSVVSANEIKAWDQFCPLALQINTARRPNGTGMDLFMRAPDQTAWAAVADPSGNLIIQGDGQIWHQMPGGSNFLGSPSGFWNASTTRLDVYAIAALPGQARHPWHTSWQSGSWASAWDGPLAGVANLTSSTQTISVAPTPNAGGANLLMQGTDKKGWYAVVAANGYFDGNWYYINGSAALAGNLTGAPRGVWNPAENRLDIFAIGTNGFPYHAYYRQGAWAGVWDPLPNTLQPVYPAEEQNISVVSWPNGGGMSLLIKGLDGTAWHAAVDPNVTSVTWEPLGKPIQGPPSGVWNNATTRFDVFAIGNQEADGTNHPYHTYYQGGWSGGWTGPLNGRAG